MLSALRSGTGFRLAVMAAFFAVSSLIALPAAMAFGHGANAPHCLFNLHKMDHGPQAAKHLHHGAAPEHEKRLTDTPKPAEKSTCCALFYLSAIAAELPPTVTIRVRSALLPLGDEPISDRTPERLDRPPNFVPSV